MYHYLANIVSLVIHQADIVDEHRVTDVAIYKNQVDHVFPDNSEKLIGGILKGGLKSPCQRPWPMCVMKKHYSMYKKNAYPVCERCWSLMLQILDIGLVEKQLDSSVMVLCQQAEKNRNLKNLLVNMQGYW